MRRSAFVLVFLIILLATIVGFGVSRLAGTYLTKTASGGGTRCRSIEQTRTFTVENNEVSPSHMNAHLCDKLVIVNKDTVFREMAFGEHDNHEAYNGVTEQLLQKNQSFSVVLNKPGTYKIHDHLHDEVAADFTVSD